MAARRRRCLDGLTTCTCACVPARAIGRAVWGWREDRRPLTSPRRMNSLDWSVWSVGEPKIRWFTLISHSSIANILIRIWIIEPGPDWFNSNDHDTWCILLVLFVNFNYHEKLGNDFREKTEPHSPNPILSRHHSLRQSNSTRKHPWKIKQKRGMRRGK